MALVKLPRADVRPREPMGKASRAGHHVGSGHYISERTSKSKKRLEKSLRVGVA